MSINDSQSPSKVAMTPDAAARIQGAQAKQNGGNVTKGTFAPRAQAAAARNAIPDASKK